MSDQEPEPSETGYAIVLATIFVLAMYGLLRLFAELVAALHG